MPDTSNNSLKLRENVAGILRDQAGRILVAERIDIRGAWQFPQGGVDPGETLEEAFAREMTEELSLVPAEYQLIDRKGPYRYFFGDGKLKKGFHGKNQHFFLGEFVVKKPRIDVATEHAEFRDTRWIAPSEFNLKWLPEMKRDLYRSVFRDFFALEL